MLPWLFREQDIVFYFQSQNPGLPLFLWNFGIKLAGYENIGRRGNRRCPYRGMESANAFPGFTWISAGNSDARRTSTRNHAILGLLLSKMPPKGSKMADPKKHLRNASIPARISI